MIVMYKCKCCKERQVHVPDRIPNSDIVEWVEQVVANCITYDHKHRSPKCKSRAMEYVKLPADNPDGVGVASTVN